MSENMREIARLMWILKKYEIRTLKQVNNKLQH